MSPFSRIGLALGAGLLIVAGGAFWIAKRQQPDHSIPPIPNLGSKVAVALDHRGIPTLQAREWGDLLRVQGYLVARDRLFQMELMRRKADGRLSELVGGNMVPMDRLHRIYDFRNVATQAVARLPKEEREDLEAYAEGVNAFIASHPHRWGLEFQMLGLQPEPWTTADSLKVLLLLHEDMSTTWKQELQREALEFLPPTTRAFLLPQYAVGDAPLVPDAHVPTLESDTFFRTPSQSVKTVAVQDLDPGFPLPDPIGRQASNNWVISGRLTASGQPLLANDPHLNLALPGVWFALRMEWDGRFAQGVALPGLPGIVIGHNDRVAWGATNLGTDVQDLYREPAQTTRQEWIRIRGGDSVELQVAIGARGPQVRPGLSLVWAALDPRNIRVPARALTTAVDWASFNQAADGWLGPAMNLIYADRKGHIGWRATGLVPRRSPGDDGSRIHSVSEAAWQGYLPASEMPRLLDPVEGFIATANNRTIGTGFPLPIATEWAGTSRVARIRQRLGASKDWTARAVEALQREDGSQFHEALELALKPRLDAPPTFTQLELIRRAFRKRLLALLLAGSTLSPASYAWQGEDAWILASAQADPDRWRAVGLGDKEAFVQGCLREARASADWDRPWTQVNELRMNHPFGLKGGLLGWVFNPPKVRVPGSAKSIRVLSGVHGQSMRMVVDFLDLESTRLVLPLGQSGHLGSPHRTDQLTAWMEGDPEGLRTRLHQPARRRLDFESPSSGPHR